MGRGRLPAYTLNGATRPQLYRMLLRGGVEVEAVNVPFAPAQNLLALKATCGP